MTKTAGFVCLLLALGLVAAAKGRYTVQPIAERGPLSRSVAYLFLGMGFALAAALLLGTEA